MDHKDGQKAESEFGSLMNGSSSSSTINLFFCASLHSLSFAVAGGRRCLRKEEENEAAQETYKRDPGSSSTSFIRKSRLMVFRWNNEYPLAVTLYIAF